MTTNRKSENINASAWSEKILSKTTFGQLLRNLREADGISQTDLAKKIFVSKQYLSDIERDRKSASIAFAKNIADTMGYAVEPMIEIIIRDDLKKNNLDFEFIIKKNVA